ncbi:MAG: type IV pilin-like G/H family protein [Limnoraphis sp.]|nr:type IV pilin-like G/H family protein [Lyngbya sp. PCC 8106]
MGADKTNVMTTATAKHSGLNSYTGIVYVVGENGYQISRSYICETQQPSQLPPSNLKLPIANGEIECSPGSQSLY